MKRFPQAAAVLAALVASSLAYSFARMILTGLNSLYQSGKACPATYIIVGYSARPYIIKLIYACGKRFTYEPGTTKATNQGHSKLNVTPDIRRETVTVSLLSSLRMFNY